MEVHFPLILDGATGTELQKRGYTGGECAEKWVLEHPEAIMDLQRRYIAAGSNVVYAPTFGANRVKLEENGIFNQVRDYNIRLTMLSRQATEGKAWVAGDIAPTGKFLAPLGDTSFEELVEIYREQASALEEADVDLFVVETMMTVSDARAAVLAIRSVSRKPIFVTFTCNAGGKTITGSDIEAVLLMMQGMGVSAFGLNCSVGPEDMLRTLQKLAKYAEVPLIAKPNAGLPEIVDGKTVYNCSPEDFTAYAQAMADAGTGIFGGCCGTADHHISALTQAVSGLSMRRPQPAHPELLALATEKKAFLLPADTRIGKILPCTEALAELLEEAEESADPVIAIRIDSVNQLDDFADNQFSITKPLCLLCEDASVLEQALQLYQGRAMYEGNLPESTLMDLQKKYGLVW